MNRNFRKKKPFHDSYCEDVYNWLNEGKSIYIICKELGISYPTFYSWKKDYPHFKEAVEQGEMCARHVYDEQQFKNMGNRNYNHVAHERAVARRFGSNPEHAARINSLKQAKTFGEKFKLLEAEIEEGNLTAKDAALLSKTLLDGFQIEKDEKIVRKMEELEALVKAH